MHPDTMRMNAVSESATSTESNGGRKLLQVANYVEIVIWGSTDRMNAFGYDVDAFIAETVLQIQLMQSAYDKSGFDPPVKFVLKQFLYTPQGHSDPWGYISSTEMLQMLGKVGTWVNTDPTQIANMQWDTFMVITERVPSFFGAVGYAYTGAICTKRSVSVNALIKGFSFDGSTTMAHEFGHNLGFAHDGSSTSGTSACDSTSNIMAPMGNGQETF